jgi:SET domain-containing protein
MLLQSGLICVKESPGKGRGVFAAAPIRKGAVIERVPVLLVPLKDLANGPNNATLNMYFYQWTKKNFACALGYGSLYNHSFEPNVLFKCGRHTMTYKALRYIEEGEELTINYNGEPEDKTPVDFNVT